MAIAEPVTLEVLDSNGHGLSVVFEKQGDRFGHTILSVQAGQTTPLLQSLEGTPEDFSPPSPPFAELHRQGGTLFLSGATTIGHWSMSVEAKDGGLLFDLACRLKSNASWLGNKYQAKANNFQIQANEITFCNSQAETLLIGPTTQEVTSFPATIQWRYTITAKS